MLGYPEMSGRAIGHLKELVAANITLAIAESGMTLAEIARHLETHEKAVRRWRKGEVTPHQDNLHRLAVLLDRDVAWFYTDHDDNGEAAA